MRKTAFHQYYPQFAAHENTLAATLAGSVQRDVYYAQARGYASCAGRVAVSRQRAACRSYDNLIASVHRHLPALHRYYDVRRRKMKLTRHPPLRHLRADPERAENAAHLGPGGASW